MADDDNFLNTYFGNSDSDGEFEGFEESDLSNIRVGMLPEFEAVPNDDDRDFPSDILLNWTREINEPLVPPFLGNSGLTVDISREAVPLDYFSLFMEDSEMNSIALETNRYFNQIRAQKEPSTYSRMNSWYDTTGSEIKRFLGLIILMGLVDKPMLSSYWSIDKLENTPAFSDYMTRDRFMALLCFLHVVDNSVAPGRGEEGFDPLYKVRPIYDVVTSRFRTAYIPDKDIVVDEGMVPWRGRLRFKQYIPSKPDKFGMKMYILSESKSGYVCDFSVYTGKDFDPDPAAEDSESILGHSYQVVMGLLRRGGLLNKGYHLFVDNYYTSPVLFDRLTAEDTVATGTLRVNRREVPTALKTKLKSGDVVFRQRGNLLAFKWFDKREVSVLSTAHTATMNVTGKSNLNGEPVIKPTCVLDYNSKMGGVDRSDQLAKYYTFTRKTNKWWLKLFFHIINLVVTNAFILYKKNNCGGKFLTHYQFRKQLARELINSHTALKPARGRPSVNRDAESRLTERHFPDFIPAKEGAKVNNPTRKCIVCNVNTGKRCAPGESRKRKETRYWCKVCEKPLCVVPCFQRYHTLINYKLTESESS